MLQQIAQCAVILQKIESCLRAQQGLGTIKRLFKQSEITTQLQSCEKELEEAVNGFKMTQGVGIASALVEFNIDTERRHQELLELISSQSGSFCSLSSVSTVYPNYSTHSSSFSLLPAAPKIFHGRDSELEHLVESLVTGSARVVILGPGGMGKTTLAVAALHHSKVGDKYTGRHFIPCDSAHTNDSLVATIAVHLGLEASSRSARHIVHHLSSGPPCLLILDNFETTWEPMYGRAKVELFLGQLADVTHVGLLITMRGAERPGTVQWTHPFLRPLLPLTQVAARQTLIEIVDEIHNDTELGHLLDITDNIPLALQLIATLVASEGYKATLERWKLERTAMLSLSVPQAADLLSLLSLLSDGISDIDLAQSNPPILDLSKCKTTLIRTSLAYVGGAGELKVLAPIREYIQMVRPPALSLVRPMRKHFKALLKPWTSVIDGSPGVGLSLAPRLFLNLGNLHNVLQHGLDHDGADLRETIQAIILLSRLSQTMRCGYSPLQLRLPEILHEINDHELSGQFIIQLFRSWEFSEVVDPEKSLHEGIEHFRAIEDPEGEALLYIAAAGYYRARLGDNKKAQDLYRRELVLASRYNHSGAKLPGLTGMASIEFVRGNHSEGIHLARELDGLRWQALCHKALGNFTHSLELVEKGKVLIAQADMRGARMETILMNIEGDAYQEKTDYAKARHVHGLILGRTSVAISPVEHAYSRVNIAFLDIVTGAAVEIVLHNLEAAASILQNMQETRGVLICELTRADLQRREAEEFGVGAKYIHLFITTQIEENELAMLTLQRLADSTYPVHAAAEVARWAVVFLAFALRSSVRNMLGAHQALKSLGDVLSHQGIDNDALNILTVALEGFTWMDVHQSRAECMRSIGDLHMRHCEFSKASTFWKEARPLFEVSLQAKSIAGIDHRLAELDQQQQQGNQDRLLNVNMPDLPVQKFSTALETSDHGMDNLEGGLDISTRSAMLDAVHT
ncbi:hypothetical protein B0H14DRAFT_2804975 [Mycena olivaceomarginata]|nr:hypothetical protein B0H14DRAFT_2804975 [Mycena olivaceomarginata]